MSFGDILKKLRQDNNLTQEELAKKINNSRSNIANYENGKNMPSVEVLEKLSELFQVSTDYLLGKSNERTPKQSDIPEIRQIERGAKKMSQKDREKMVNMIMAAFEEAFNEDSDSK